MPDIFDTAAALLAQEGDEGESGTDRALRLADLIRREAEEHFEADGPGRSLDPLATCLHGRANAGETYACLVLLAAACDIAADVVRSVQDRREMVSDLVVRPLLQCAGDLLVNDFDALNPMREEESGAVGGPIVVPIRAEPLARMRPDDREEPFSDDLLGWCAVHLWTIARTLDECSSGYLREGSLTRLAPVVRALRTLDHAHFMFAEVEHSGQEHRADNKDALDALFRKRSRLTGRLAQHLRDALDLEPPLFKPPIERYTAETLLSEDWMRPVVEGALEVARHTDAGELNDALRALTRTIHTGLDDGGPGHDRRLVTAQRLRMISCGLTLGEDLPLVYNDTNRIMGELVSFVRETFQINLPETREPSLPRAFRAHLEAHLEALALAVDPGYMGRPAVPPRTSIWRGRGNLFPVPENLGTEHIIANTHDRLKVHDPVSDNIERADDEHRCAVEELAEARARLLSELEELENQADLMLEDDEVFWPSRSVVLPLEPVATDGPRIEGGPGVMEFEFRRHGTPMNVYIDPVTGQLIRTDGLPIPEDVTRDLTDHYLEAAEEYGRNRDEFLQHDWHRRGRGPGGRFSRQESVPGWDQGRLQRTVAVVVGLGGLGAAVVDQLARMGVGTIRVVDHDRVEDSNISRQCLYIADDVGSLKVDAAARRVSDLDGPSRIVPRPAYLCERNALMLVAGADVVFDCLDSEDAKRLLNRACARADVPLVHGGCTGFIGQAMAVVPGRTACLFCRELTFSAADTASCTRDEALPIVAPTAQLVASLQVDLALHVLMGTSDVPSGLLLYDGRGPGVRSVPLERREDCPVCGGEGTMDDDVRAALSFQSQDSLLRIAGAVGMEHADKMDTVDLVNALVDVFAALPDGRHRALRLASGVQYIEEAVS